MKKLVTSAFLVFVVPFIHFLLALAAPSLVKLSFVHILLIYSMLAILTAVHLFVVKKISQNKKDQAPLIVVALNMLKMIVSVVLLFVVVVPFTGKGGAVALNFAAAYFFFLVFDSQMVILLLNSDADNVQKQ